MADIIWDNRPFYVYAQTPKDRFEVLKARYSAFLKVLDDVNKDPVAVFYPLRECQKTELQLMREVSQVLQAKKDEDIRKSQAAATVEDEPQAEKEDTEVTEKENEATKTEE